jgi:hypothetical protein
MAILDDSNQVRWSSRSGRQGINESTNSCLSPTTALPITDEDRVSETLITGCMFWHPNRSQQFGSSLHIEAGYGPIACAHRYRSVPESSLTSNISGETFYMELGVQWTLKRGRSQGPKGTAPFEERHVKIIKQGGRRNGGASR